MLSLTPTSVQCIHHKPSTIVSACTEECIFWLQSKRTKEGVDIARECMREESGESMEGKKHRSNFY